MNMPFLWYQWLALIAFAVCAITLLFHFVRLVWLGKPDDLARPAGNTTRAIRYAFTGAMSPAKKESAYLHLPTYTAGLLYHSGTFLSFLLFFFFLAGWLPIGWLSAVIIIFICVTATCGIAILVKRIIKKELLSLSNPDDFISNILVTLFQISTVLFLLYLTVLPSYRLIVFPSTLHSVRLFYYLSFTILMLYLPVGKLRHLVYFFAARYHLGYFFGKRGVWPPQNAKY